MKRSFLLALTVLLASGGLPAHAHAETAFTGPVTGIVASPINPTFRFSAEARWSGLMNGLPASGHYVCDITGGSTATLPLGGPLWGSYTCTTPAPIGAAPATVSGSFTGSTTLSAIRLAGSFNPGGHTIECAGQGVPIFSGSPSIPPDIQAYEVAVNCVIL